MTITVFGSVQYQEGVWTPVIAGASTAGTQTYTTQVGTYTQNGKRVTVDFTILLSALDGATAGSVTIAGLPFAAKTLTGANFVGSIGTIGSITHDATRIQFGIRMASAAQAITLYEFGVAAGAAGAAAVAATALAATSAITGSISYLID